MIERLLVYRSPGNDPFRNLAAEEYFLRRVRTGEVILYLWRNRSTVVVGRNQDVWSECRVEELQRDGGLLARRLSGGGAVYHDLGNLNFTFAVREEDYDVAHQTEVLLHAVRSFGIGAEISGRNDLTARERKFSGHAYYKSGGACFQHGTLMVAVDGEKLSRYLCVPEGKLLRKGVPSVRSRVVNLTELCPTLTVPALEERIEESFGEVYGLPVERLGEDSLDSDALAALTERFASHAWRFGEARRFRERSAYTLRGSFPWGEVTVEYDVENGVLRNVRLTSDGLEADLLASVPALLEGRRFEPAALSEALRGGGEVCADILGLFQSDLEGSGNE